jgi:hypothetical protein
VNHQLLDVVSPARTISRIGAHGVSLEFRKLVSFAREVVFDTLIETRRATSLAFDQVKAHLAVNLQQERRAKFTPREELITGTMVEVWRESASNGANASVAVSIANASTCCSVTPGCGVAMHRNKLPVIPVARQSRAPVCHKDVGALLAEPWSSRTSAGHVTESMANFRNV